MPRINRDPNRLFWPSWWYNPDGEGQVFNSLEEVPDGWTRRQTGQTKKTESRPTQVLDREELKSKLTEMGVEINPMWGNAHMKRIIDGDIRPIG